MDFVFGQKIRFAFSALDGENKPVAPFSLVSARLYASSPTDAQALDETGALLGFEEKLTTWTAGEGEEKILTFAALADPNPLSSPEFYLLYYVAVSFKYETGAPTQVRVFPIKVRRAQAATSRVYIDYDDVKDLDEKIYAVRSTTQISAKIEIAKRMALRRMSTLDVERHEVEENDLNDAVLFLACQLLCQGLISQPGDVWSQKADNYGAWYERIWAEQKVRVDLNDDGLKDDETGESVRTWSGEVTR